MKLIDLIRKQCKEQGIPEKYAERIIKISGITEDKDGSVAKAVTSFKENVYVDIQAAEADAEKARQTAIEEYEKKHNIKNGVPLKKEDDPADDDPADDEIDLTGMDETTRKIIQSQSKKIDVLTGLVEKVVTTQNRTHTLESVKSRLSGKVDDKFIDRYSNRVNLDADSIDDEIERVSKEFAEDKQAFLNEAVKGGNYQPVDGGISDKDFDDYAKRQSTENSEFNGIEI